MKTVFTNNEIMHVFAQRTQSNGRASNLFFEYGIKLYSYGWHYLLGEFIENKQGSEAIMINDRGYSVSTQKHISMLRSATRQFKQFFTTETDLELVLTSIFANVKKLQTARKKELYIETSKRLFENLNEFILWSGKTELKKSDLYKKIVDLMKVIDGDKEFYSTYLRKNADKIKRDKAKAEKIRKQKLAQSILDFENYEINRIYNSNEDYLRLSKDGE